MKRTVFLSMLALFCLFGGSAWAQTFTQGSLKYTVTDADAKTVSVAKATNDICGSFVLPSKVTNEGVTYTVTSVSQSGFDAVGITSLTIPSTMVELGTWAFSNCSSLATITIQEADEPLSICCGYYAAFRGSDADKVVTINRNLTIYDGNTPFPNTTRVKFGDKVTTICDNLFYNANKLASVQMGSGITSIGNGAFYSAGYDEGVDRMVVVMGGNVKTIGPNAFEYCSRLKSVTLPSTLKVVGNNAFANTGLTGVTIPASVDSLAYWAFAGNNDLTSFVIADCDNELKFTSGYYGTFAGGNSDKTIYIGRDMTPSEDTAPFTNPTSVTFGDKVTTINPNLFYNANKLAKVVIGKGVTSINSSAFYSTGDDESVEEQVVSFGTNVTFIGPNAFEYCSRLKSVTLPSTLKVVGNQAFANTGLTGVTIPASVDSLAYWAFAGNNDLTSFVIADCDHDLKFTSGYYGTFAGGNSDKTIYIGRDMTPSENTAPFANATSVEFGDNVTTIFPYMFNGAKKLANVTMGTGITEIGHHAFYDSGDGETVPEMFVTIGRNVKTIGANAFEGCDSLKSIALPSVLKSIDGYAFASTGLTGISIPVSVDTLGDRVFGSCPNLTSIRIKDSSKPLKLKNGYYGTFAYSDAEKTVYVGRDLERNSNGERVISNPTSVEIGDQVTAINPYMFYDSNKLANVTIGRGVKTIGEYAFRGSGDDETVDEMVVTMGENVKTIGGYAFHVCNKLRSITLPSTLKTIDGYAFQESGLTGITIPASVDSLGDKAFAYCPLTNITFEDGDKTLSMTNGYYGTFSNPQADNTLYLGRNLVYGEKNDSPFPNVTAVNIGPKVTDLPQRLFYNRDNLTTVTGGENVATMGVGVYYYCDNLTSVSPLGKNLKVLPESTFESCPKVDGIVLPDGLEEIQQWAFHSCSSLTELTIPASVKVMGKRPDGENGYRVFRGNDAMKKLVIADSDEPLLFIDNYGDFFNVMPALEYVYMGRDITFEGSSRIPFDVADQIELGSNVTEIGKYFRDCRPTTVKVPWTTPITITDEAFYSSTYNDAKLLVPGGTKAKYAAAEGWKKFLNVETWSAIVTLTATSHGSIATAYGTATGNTVQFNQPKDEPLVYTLTADNGYKLSALTDNGIAVSPLPTLGAEQSRAIGSEEESITLSATFAPISYTISYDLAGGALANGVTNRTSYTIETNTFTLNNPTREHYDFAGWTGTGLTAPTKTVTIAKGSTGNRSYKATWEKKTYTVTITGAGVTASNYSPKYGESVVITIADDPDRSLSSLTVNGTDVTSQVKNNQYTITNVSSNIEVVATFVSTKEFITLTGEYAMFSCSQDLNFTGSSLRAYIASGFNKATSQVLLTPVTDVPAGTGIFLIGTPGHTYKIPYSESTSYYVNLFQANLQRSTVSATSGNYSNYTFGEQGGEPGFYPISGSTTLQAQTAYLQLPSSFVTAGVKVSVVFEDDVIDGMVDMSEWSNMSDQSVIYDLSGRRLGKTQRGVNIVNGKKILVK